MRPKTGFARNGDVRIAYQVVGEGPLDLVMTPGFVSHVDLWWMLPETRNFFERLASFSRLVLYDKRGTGLSDPVAEVPSMEVRMEDLHAVLDAVDSERAALFGFSEGGPLSMLFAAAYPERTAALALFGSFPRWPGADFFPEYVPLLDEVIRTFDDIVDHWGEGRLLDLFAPDYADDPVIRHEWGLFERLSASPAMAAGLLEAVRRIDVRHALSSIQAPTLVMHRQGEVSPAAVARYLAEHIPDAQLVEFAGSSHVPWLGNADAVLDTIEEFLTGAGAASPPDRALVTVLFTDIVGSTELAGQLGDTRWHTLLQRHDALVDREVRRAGGTVVKSLGDGILARFDSPARGVRAGRRVVTTAREELGLAIRAGVHTGECELLGEDLGGMAVHVGARIAAKAAAGEVLVSSVVRDLVLGSPLRFAERGTHELKGVPGQWQLLAVTDVDRAPASAPAPASRAAPNATIASPADLATARVARVAARDTRVGRRVGAAARWGLRLRRPTDAT